ncbi:putative ATP-dependent RNA helicase DHR1 [Pleurotus pulmonarius]|nr:putative ATP-dependent RNA helicase DHR1 [Pleurotus pulmonarius]KAF4590862.1 putative ATP-dependent RNA helicase DHR1 [Pleurotus pulmonarius]
MGPPTHTKYNAKARQTSKTTRKRRKSQPEIESDPNTAILTPKTAEEREREQKEKLKQQLIAESESNWNSKKKPSDYSSQDKKLKKEERVHIFEKLTKSQAELPSSLALHTSSTLGTGKPTTHQERLERSEDKQVRQIVDGKIGSRKRPLDQYEHFSAASSDDDDGGGKEHESRPAINDPPTVGSALVQNGKDRLSSPSRKAKPSTYKVPMSMLRKSGLFDFVSSQSWTGMPTQRSQANSDSDTSFDSSDSENDSSSSGSEDGRGSDNDSTAEEPPKAKKRSLGFKQWAMKQIETAKGYETSKPIMSDPPVTSEDVIAPPPTKKRKVEPQGGKHGPLGELYQLPSTSFASHLNSLHGQTLTKGITIQRPPEVQESRLLLPIVAEEQPIMEAILLNPIVIVCGETGSGKTTQVPQFLYEAGFGTPGSDNPGMIGVTQPRRVAAMSMASRVAHELSLTSSKVSYQIRYDGTVSPDTSIKFMTDGVLLRELATDFLLTKYSVIIIDEAHERSINTDILIGVLSRVLKLREDMWKNEKDGPKPLRLIIMSATLRVSDFAENRALFPSPPPIINVAARQHPVTVHFSRRTSSDYVNEAIRKVGKIHTRLPPGGILVFLTGQNEINGVCRRLEEMFGKKAHSSRNLKVAVVPKKTPTDTISHIALEQADVEAEEMELGFDAPEEIPGDDDGGDEFDVDDLESDDDGDRALNEELGLNAAETESFMHIVPLYSLLPSDKQMKVFETPPPNSRLVVVSTNVAETSLTIPGIRYVVDCGRAKERRYDILSGIQSFQVTWVSKASAAQRAGRAGRTGPGHCYRLYSSALFEHHFDKFTQPEILRTPIEGIVLQMKSMHIDVVANFPFPTSPDRDMLRKAEKLLMTLGALGSPTAGAVGGEITVLGKSMALFPLHPRFSRMLVSGQQHGSLPYVIAMVAALAVGDPFIHEEGLATDDDGDNSSSSPEAVRARRQAYFQTKATHSSLGNSMSDVFKVLSVVGAYEYAGGGHKFCADHFVRLKMMEEIHKLRSQISNIIEAGFLGTSALFTPQLPPPSDLQVHSSISLSLYLANTSSQLKSLRQLLTGAFIDQVAVRKDLVDQNTESGIQYSMAKGIPYRAIGIDEDVFLHPSSVLAGASPPQYVIYTEVVRTSRAWLKGQICAWPNYDQP